MTAIRMVFIMFIPVSGLCLICALFVKEMGLEDQNRRRTTEDKPSEDSSISNPETPTHVEDSSTSSENQEKPTLREPHSSIA